MLKTWGISVIYLKYAYTAIPYYHTNLACSPSLGIRDPGRVLAFRPKSAEDIPTHLGKLALFEQNFIAFWSLSKYLVVWPLHNGPVCTGDGCLHSAKGMYTTLSRLLSRVRVLNRGSIMVTCLRQYLRSRRRGYGQPDDQTWRRSVFALHKLGWSWRPWSFHWSVCRWASESSTPRALTDETWGCRIATK